MPVFRRARLQLVMEVLQAITILTDAIPPRYRFGHWNRLLNLLAFREPLPVVLPAQQPAATSAAPLPNAQDHPLPPTAEKATRCLLIAGELDTGGVESVVATLARGLASEGVEVEVVYSRGGRTETALRHDGIPLAELRTEQLRDFVGRRDPDVIQLHRIDLAQMEALAPWATRTVPVFHNIEIYLPRSIWQHLTRFVEKSPTGIAVSADVSEYFLAKTGFPTHVVNNGVPPATSTTRAQRDDARSRIGSALQLDIAPDELLVLSLQRFSPQKNTAGLVDAFLLAAEHDPRLRLLVAGAPNSWLEVRRADIIRRRHHSADRVHFLGDSDPLTLLAGADIFAMNSFFEGCPVAALEAFTHGLPIVLADVGFAQELIAVSGSNGILVERANKNLTEKSIAAQRRRTAQANRDAFAAGVLTAVERASSANTPNIPSQLTEAGMVARHAEILRTASRSARK